jgi:hypothetical protein
MIHNPKLVGSNVIDCIPVAGRCPNNCNPCFYNEGEFFHDINEPLIPTLEEVGDKIVRVNSGRDSTIDFEEVIQKTKQYPKKFYNTSLSDKITEFPAPVVFTCNRKNHLATLLLKNTNLMFVRVRTAYWNTDIVNIAVEHYTSMGVPVVLTFLYFSDRHIGNSFPIEHLDKYEKVKHIVNDRYFIKPEYWRQIVSRYKNKSDVYTCGTLKDHTCKSCRNCERLYYRYTGG